MSAPSPFDISTWDGSVSTLRLPDELDVHPGTVEAAGSIPLSFDGRTIETHVLEWLIAAIDLFEHLRVARSKSRYELYYLGF